MSQFYSGQNGCFIAKHPMSMQQYISIKEGDIVQLNVKALHKYIPSLTFVTSKYNHDQKMYVLLNDAGETVVFNMENIRVEQIGNGLISFINDNGEYAMRFELSYHEMAVALLPALFGDAYKMFYMRHKMQTASDVKKERHKFSFIYNGKDYEISCCTAGYNSCLFSEENLPDDVKAFVVISAFDLIHRKKNKWKKPRNMHATEE